MTKAKIFFAAALLLVLAVPALSYTRNTNGTTLDGMLDALSDLAKAVTGAAGDDHASYSRVGGAQVATATASISNGGSLSSSIDLGTARLARISMPSAWDAAVLSFQASNDGSTFGDLYDASGNEYSVTVAASHETIVPLTDFLGIRYLKVRSGKAGSPVTQTASRSITLVLVP